MAIPTKKKGDDSSGGRQELWPEGEYDAFVSGAVDGKSKSSSRPMLTLELTLQHPEDPAKEKTINYYVTYHKYTKDGDVEYDADGDPVQSFSCKNFIEALVDTAVDGENGVESAALIGRRCKADVEWEKEEYRGKVRTRERIKWLNRHDDGPIVPGGEQPAPTGGAAADDVDDLPF